MGLGNVLILSQVTVYLLAFIFSFFIFIPLAVNNAEFNGQCLLYAKGSWVQGNGTPTSLQIEKWGMSSNCNFPIFIGIVMFLLSLFYLFWMSVYLFKGTDPSWLSAFVALVTALILGLAGLVSAIIVTVGFTSWCSLLRPQVKCEDAEYMQLTTETDIDTSHFYIEFGMVQFGLWMSFVGWLMLSIFGAVQIYRYNQQEDFFTSMQRERERWCPCACCRPANVEVLT